MTSAFDRFPNFRQNRNLLPNRRTTAKVLTAALVLVGTPAAVEMSIQSVAQAQPFGTGSTGSLGGGSTTAPPTTTPLPPDQTGTTVVSLTFDDSNADTLAAGKVLKSKGLLGTYFTTSGYIGAPGYLAVTDLKSLAADGHEIAGHTIGHLNLVDIPATEATRQVCNDRVNLSNWGLPVANFAYPYASANPVLQAIVAECGYNSARGLGDIQTRFGCPECDYAEAIPPGNSMLTRAPAQVDNTWTLQDLQNTVTNAENDGGGWVQFTFHHVCAGCSPLAISPALFEQFATWLAARPDSTQVKTVGQVIGGTTAPAHPGTAVPAPGPGVNGIKNPSFETAGTGGLPECWFAGGYGVNSPTFATVTPGRTGAIAHKLTMTGLATGDAKLMPTLDLGNCAPTVTPGHTYSLRAWYTATTTTQFAVYRRNAVGAWSYWTSSPWFAATDTYTEAQWTTPEIPDGYTGISFGLNLFGNGELVTDDYSLYDMIVPPPGASDPQSRMTEPQPARPNGPPADIQLYVPGPGATAPGQPFAPVER